MVPAPVTTNFAGAPGTGFTVKVMGADTQPVVVLVVTTLYTPGANPAKVVVACVTPATTGFVPVRV